MSRSRVEPMAALPVLPPMPGWIVSHPVQGLESAAFRSGAALAHLAGVAAVPDLPEALWRDRLALMAAERCARQSGRRETLGALRDAVHLTRAGDDPGPAGRLVRQWSRAVAGPISVAHLGRVLEGVAPDRIAEWLDMPGDTPPDRAGRVVAAVLEDRPQAEAAALILADAVMAKAMGWARVLPILTLGVMPRDLRLRDDDLRLACHRAVVAGVGQALPMAAELARGAARLRASLPKLRAKGAGRAVDLFLTRDALAPVALDFMSDRAARRLCDRLVGMGALRELTGRDTFRLYGL